MITQDNFVTQFKRIRNLTEQLCQPLIIEDFGVQAMEDVSPPKWHLAHTTWFFETFILKRYLRSYTEFNEHFGYLFNSYYQSIGKPYQRSHRGFLSRPSVEMIYQYREWINSILINFVSNVPCHQWKTLESTLVLGLEHEQQHQELLLMDIKYNFSINPTFPRYQSFNRPNVEQQNFQTLIKVPGGVTDIGYHGDDFCFDNELPRHKKIINPFSIGSNLISNQEYLEFMKSDGYQNPEYWLSDGFVFIQNNNIRAPLYWYQIEGDWHIFTLNGLQKINLSEPVSHVSFYEADAFAKWRKARLPTEEEWEYFVNEEQLDKNSGQFIENGEYHPSAVQKLKDQFFGYLWEWTSSPYRPYPGYKQTVGALGEYNGKFMCNQMVLKGGSCITPKQHIRTSYRNFFQPEKRWQFSGIRLALDL